jgi:DNA-binding transcriptional regulator YbjK
MTTTTQGRIQTIAPRRTARELTQAETRAEAAAPSGLVIFYVLTVLFFVLVGVSLVVARQIGA